METIVYLMLNFGFGITFLLLGGCLFFLYMPKHARLKNYRTSRYILGTSYVLMSVYCILRIFIHHSVSIYESIWILIMFCMVFMWLNYSSFLFAMSSSKKLTKGMFMDGIFPVLIMLALGTYGYLIESLREEMKLSLILFYLVKTIWMFRKCLIEWKACNEEINDTNLVVVDIKWMKKILWGIFIISILSITSYFFEILYIFYIPLILFTFIYLAMKMINFMPIRVENIRSANQEVKEPEKPVELIDKIGPKLDIWISEKKFCKPDLTIKGVAEAIGTNQNYLSAYLNKHLNMNFQTWLNTLRVEEGKILLLKEKKLSIEEISQMVGITQNYNFSKWFKLVNGITPFQYRKQNLS